MKINNVIYLVKEGIKSVFVHGFMSFAAICVTVACLLIMGMFASVMYNVNILVEELNQTNQIMVYIEEDLPDSQAKSIETEIRAVDNVYRATFVSKEEALEDFIADHQGDPVFSGVEADDLRHRVVVVLEDNRLMDDTLEDLRKINGVAEVKAYQELAEGFAMIQDILEGVFALVLTVLLVVSLLIISNTVRIAMYGRREEIAIMKMVGATNGFIRLPFIVQGFLLGMLGASIAFALQWWLYDAMVLRIEAMDTLNMFKFVPFRRLLWPMVLTFMGAGMFVGVVGSWSSIRKFLKV